MSSPRESFLILGLGELGAAVLDSLTKRSPSSRFALLIRPETLAAPSPDRRAELEELRAAGVEFVTADLASENVHELAKILVSFDTVVGCTGFAAGKPIQRKLCQAVLEAGVARYVPWQFGVDYDVIGRGSAQELFDEQLDVRDLLRAQTKTEWIIISTGMFTSFLFEPTFGVVALAEDTVYALGSFDTAVTVTTARDIGSLTAEVLFSEPRIRNSVVYTAGDTVTYEGLAQIVEQVLGRELKRKRLSVRELEEALARDPHDTMKKYRVVFAQGRGVSWDKSQTFNAQHGLLVTGVQQWAREHFDLVG